MLASAMCTKLLRLRRENWRHRTATRTVEERVPKLSEKQLLKLVDLVAHKPEATLEELRDRLKKGGAGRS